MARPCPFCASTDLQIVTLPHWTFVSCGNCRTRGPMVTLPATGATPETDRDVIEKWDTRRQKLKGKL